jgi:hypothetical protein
MHTHIEPGPCGPRAAGRSLTRGPGTGQLEWPIGPMHRTGPARFRFARPALGIRVLAHGRLASWPDHPARVQQVAAECGQGLAAIARARPPAGLLHRFSPPYKRSVGDDRYGPCGPVPVNTYRAFSLVRCRYCEEETRVSSESPSS